METKSNSKKIIVAIVVLVVILAVALGLYFKFAQKTSQGSKSITVSIVYEDGSRDDYEHHTDAEYLMDAVNEIGEISIVGSGEGASFYMDSVNGVTADYDADGAYWAIYVDGAYGSYGIMEQPVADGSSYEIRYEVWTE